MPAVQRPVVTGDRLVAAFGLAPFTVAQAEDVNITRACLRAALERGILVRLRRGVLVEASAYEQAAPARRHLLEARAAQLCVPGSVLSHETGLCGYDLPSPRPQRGRPPRPTLTASPSAGHVAGVRVVRAALSEVDIRCIDGWPITSVARTAVDVARGLPLPESLVVLDAAARLTIANRSPYGRVDRLVEQPAHRDRARHELAEAAGRSESRRHSVGLVDALARTDPRAESAMESRSRGVFHLARLPEPELQYRVQGDNGRWYRSDFAWPASRVLGEADGMVKYDTIDAVRAEKYRQDALTRAGWVTVRWTWQELTTQPAQLITRIQSALITR